MIYQNFYLNILKRNTFLSIQELVNDFNAYIINIILATIEK